MKPEDQTFQLITENKALRNEISYLKALLAEQTHDLASITRELITHRKKLEYRAQQQNSLLRNPLTYFKNIYRTIKFLRALRKTDLFDPTWYREQYPDILNRRLFSQLPELHYLFHGSIELRATSKQFNGKRYVERYPDIESSGLPPLIHYLLHGKSEGRKI